MEKKESETGFCFCFEPVDNSVKFPEPSFLGVASRVQRPASRVQEFRYACFSNKIYNLKIDLFSFLNMKQNMAFF